MWASAHAAVGVITELVNVHASLSVGIVARDVVADSGWGRLVGLLECDGSLDGGITSKDSNCGSIMLVD